MSSVSIPTLRSSSITSEAISSASTPASFFEANAVLQNGTTTGDGAVYTILFATEVYDEGSDFVGATGIFTAPTAGYYQFSVNVDAEGLDNVPTMATLAVVCSVGADHVCVVGNPTVDELNINRSFSTHLSASETVRVNLTITGASADTVVDILATSSFAGYRIST